MVEGVDGFVDGGNMDGCRTAMELRAGVKDFVFVSMRLNVACSMTT